VTLDSHKYCMDVVASLDPWRYPAILFLPKETRKAAASLYAFFAEIERIATAVSEPLPGEIRMQWWREAIEGERQGEARANPVAASLLEIITQYDLPRSGFTRLLEAKLFDLYNDPVPDLGTLEAYFGETESFLLQMVNRVMSAADEPAMADACGHGGVAYGIAVVMKDLSVHHHFKRSYIPSNMLKAAGLSTEDWLAGEKDAHAIAVEAFAALALDHLSKAENAIAQLPSHRSAAFLPLALVEPLIRRSRKHDNRIINRPVNLSPLNIHWNYWKSAIFNR